MQKQLLSAQYSFYTRVGMGVLFAGVGILALALILSFKDMLKQRKKTTEEVKPKDERSGEAGSEPEYNP
jgi:hypothetical protein